jgi:hypothetical protein
MQGNMQWPKVRTDRRQLAVLSFTSAKDIPIKKIMDCERGFGKGRLKRQVEE